MNGGLGLEGDADRRQGRKGRDSGHGQHGGASGGGQFPQSKHSASPMFVAT
jgi:hypothetical protein